MTMYFRLTKHSVSDHKEPKIIFRFVRHTFVQLGSCFAKFVLNLIALVIKIRFHLNLTSPDVRFGP